MSTEPPRRFYTSVTVTDDGAGILLDARRLKTPRGNTFAAPTRALANLVAEEWAEQGERVLTNTMPMTQLAFAAIDNTASRREEVLAYVAKYGETDLVCHRADAPSSLVARQSALWDPLAAWMERELGVQLSVVAGVLPAEPNTRAVARIQEKGAALDDFRLTALAQATGLAGSVVIGFAMLLGGLDAATAYNAATIDEAWNIENWGEDGEARARLDNQRAEYDAIAAFIIALGAT